jgi:DNA-binding response OmpR family regulator
MNESATILVADPEPGVLERATRALLYGETRYEVIQAREGAQAYRTIQVVRPDLVLLAVDLAGIDGPTIVGALTHSPIHRTRPFVGLVEEGDEAAARRMIASGAREVVTRPFSERELRRRVAAVLGHPEPAACSPVLLVCSDEDYGAVLADALEERADVRVTRASVGLFAVARAEAENPRAILVVDPVADLDPIAFLVKLRAAGIPAPVIVIGDPRGECAGLRFVGRRRALDEAPSFVRTLIRSGSTDGPRPR